MRLPRRIDVISKRLADNELSAKLEVPQINVLVEGMEHMLQRLVREDIEVVTALEPYLGMVRADADQMSQILINLAANARDAMPEGGKLCIRTANVELREGPAAGDGKALSGPAVLLAVSDTGVGMNYSTRQSIFEPFFTTKEKGRGTGLGLATVYGIVKQNNGSIEVQSEPGKGATFSIYLPRTMEVRVQEAPMSPAAVQTTGEETILLVEDQEAVRESAAEYLEFKNRFFKNEPRVKMNCDVGHLFCVGEDPADVVRRFSDHIAHVHVEDIGKNRVHQHLTPGAASTRRPGWRAGRSGWDGTSWLSRVPASRS